MQKLKSYYALHKNRIDFILPIAYFLILIAFFFQIKSIINAPSIEVKEKSSEPERKEQEAKKLDTTLVLVDNNQNTLVTYEYSIDNRRTVDDLLQELRQEKGLFYEKVHYIDELQLTQVLRQEVPKGYKWQIYLGDKNVTNDIEDTAFIENDDESELKLVLEETR